MARRHKEVEHENHERWLVSYADFITLLFAFFTVLYALSQQDTTKYKDAVKAIQRAFVHSGGLFSLKGSPFTPFEIAPDRGTAVPPNPTEAGRFPKTEEDAAPYRIAEQLRGIFKQETGLALNEGDVEVMKTETGYRIRLGEYLMFSPGSDKIRRESIPFLYNVGKRLKRLNLPIEVEGHSDNSAFSTPLKNWELSISRAFHVVQFLVHGVAFPVEKISLGGYGDTQPIAGNNTPQGRERNRRVEITIKVPDLTNEEFSWEAFETN